MENYLSSGQTVSYDNTQERAPHPRRTVMRVNTGSGL